jgi:uncharacterized membrane protein
MAGSEMIDAPAIAARDGDVRATEVPRDEKAVTWGIVTINRPRQELYDFWRDFSNLPRVMENVAGIECADATRSTWTVKAPAGRTVSWDAVVTREEPGELIEWQSAEGSQVRNSGRIEFRDAGPRGTIVRATIAYDPPGGIIGDLIARLFQRAPALQAQRDLRRFKQYMETGEISTSARTRAQVTDLPVQP